MKSGDPKSKRGLSFPVIVISGVTAAFFLMLTFIVLRYLFTQWSPSLEQVEALLSKGKYAEALGQLERVEENYKKSAPLLTLKGSAWLSLAIKKEQRSRWKEYGKDDREWLKSIEADKAEKYLKQAIDLDQQNSQAHLLLGILYMEKGWFSTAETEFLAVLHNNKDHVEARRHLGIIYTETGRYDLSEKELTYALMLDPENTSVMKNLCWLYRYYLDKPDSAIVWANRYLNMNPQNDLDINFVRKELLNMLNRYPEFSPQEPMTWKKSTVQGRGLEKYRKASSSR